MKNFILVLIILLAAVLRFYKLGSVPPSLYWDEASLGYNAYSILKTARDEHGKFLPLTNFAAFGDYKPPGYIYATVPSVAIFGLNEFATRFPSAFFGILTVLLSYFIAKRLFQNETVAQISAFFLAISPWHLQFSRGAFEANLGLFFSTLGILLFLKFSQDKVQNLLSSFFLITASGLFFLAGMYTFTGQRLFVPFILIVLILEFKKQIFSNLRIIILSAFINLLIFWPLFRFTTGTIEGRLRFDEVTIFKDLAPINESTRYRQRDNYSWWANLVHNRRFFYAYQYLIHYFDAFNPSFLFIRGDVNPRLSVQYIGELYLFDLPLILAGIYLMVARKEKYRWLIFGWLLVSPIGPATARETPHALRMIHILPTFQLISAYGLYHLYRSIKFKKFFVVISGLIILLSVYYYLHMYYLHWPRNFSGDWQYGYKQAVQIVGEHYDKVDRVIVTKSLGRPYIFFLLYLRFHPQDFWESAQITRDRFFFLDVERFDKFIFTDSPGDTQIQGKVLYVVRPGELPENAQKIVTIADLSKKSVFEIGSLTK